MTPMAEESAWVKPKYCGGSAIEVLGFCYSHIPCPVLIIISGEVFIPTPTNQLIGTVNVMEQNSQMGEWCPLKATPLMCTDQSRSVQIEVFSSKRPKYI